jgi:hypothetical protein
MDFIGGWRFKAAVNLGRNSSDDDGTQWLFWPLSNMFGPQGKATDIVVARFPESNKSHGESAWPSCF